MSILINFLFIFLLLISFFLLNLFNVEKYTLIKDLIGALLTFIIIIVAIWGERIKQLWKKPKLIISLDSSEGVSNVRNDGKEAQYFILNIENERRSSPAKNVRVLLINIFQLSPDGNLWQEMDFSKPVHVTWRWPDRVPSYTTIGPREQATFGYVINHEPYFRLQLYWCPNNLNPNFPAGESFRFLFQAVSDIAESNILTIEIKWDEHWEISEVKI